MDGDFFQWSSWVYGLIGAVAVVAGWLGLKRGKNKTHNVAEGSKRVRQQGGKGSTENIAKNSEDVDQRG